MDMKYLLSLSLSLTLSLSLSLSLYIYIYIYTQVALLSNNNDVRFINVKNGAQRRKAAVVCNG